MTNMLIPASQIVSCLPARIHQISFLQIWISPKVSILIICFVHILQRLCRFHQKHEPKSISPKNSSLLPISRTIALCFFVASGFIVISPIKLFQEYISIIRRPVLAAISCALLPLQAWSRIIKASTVSTSLVHLSALQLASWWIFVCCEGCTKMLFDPLH